MWAIESDIRHCYPSIDGQKIGGLLPIPEQVTRSVLLGGSLNLSICSKLSFNLAYPGADEHYYATEFATARRGLPQGSAASPLVAEMLLAPLLADLPTCGAWIGYADNFLAMGKSEEDVVSMTSAFWGAVKAHPAGPLRLKPPFCTSRGVPFDFLGHRLRPLDGQVQILPSPENLAKFKAKFAFGLRSIHMCKGNHQYPAQRLKLYVRSWTSTFRACAGIEKMRMQALKRIADAAV